MVNLYQVLNERYHTLKCVHRLDHRGKSFAVSTFSAYEKKEWMDHINKCIEDLLRKSGKKAVDEHAVGPCLSG